MSNITKYEPLSVDALTEDQRELLRNYICKNATKLELQHFFMYANKLELDPFVKDIYFIKYGNSPPAIVVGINGFRKVAARSGVHSGTERGVTRNVDGKVISAWAKVYRKDWQVPATVEVDLAEFDANTPKWKDMPGAMLMKVAESHALRIAFPELLSDVYAEEELEKSTIKDVPNEPSNASVIAAQLEEKLKNGQ